MSQAPRPREAETPPPLGTWRGWYAVVAGELAVLVLAFWALSRWAQS